MGKHSKHKRSHSDRDGGGADDEESRRRRRKEHAKSTETDAEKRERRLAKKAKKAEKRKDSEKIAGYTNEMNPFGDTQLTERFVWHKKADALGDQPKLSREQEKRQRVQRLEEVAKVSAPDRCCCWRLR